MRSRPPCHFRFNVAGRLTAVKFVANTGWAANMPLALRSPDAPLPEREIGRVHHPQSDVAALDASGGPACPSPLLDDTFEPMYELSDDAD